MAAPLRLAQQCGYVVSASEERDSVELWRADATHEADALQARQELLTTELQRADLQMQLNDVIGLPLTTSLLLDPNVSPMGPPSERCERDACVREAQDSHPDIVEARAQVEKAAAAADAAALGKVFEDGVERIELEPVDSYRLELENLSDAIRGEGKPLLDREDAVAQAGTIAALRRSTESGTPVSHNNVPRSCWNK